MLKAEGRTGKGSPVNVEGKTASNHIQQEHHGCFIMAPGSVSVCHAASLQIVINRGTVPQLSSSMAQLQDISGHHVKSDQLLEQVIEPMLSAIHQRSSSWVSVAPMITYVCSRFVMVTSAHEIAARYGSYGVIFKCSIRASQSARSQNALAREHHLSK